MTSLLQKGKDEVKTLYSEDVYNSQDLDSDSCSNQEIWKCMYLSVQSQYTFTLGYEDILP